MKSNSQEFLDGREREKMWWEHLSPIQVDPIWCDGNSSCHLPFLGMLNSKIVNKISLFFLFIDLLE